MTKIHRLPPEEKVSVHFLGSKSGTNLLRKSKIGNPSQTLSFLKCGYFKWARTALIKLHKSLVNNLELGALSLQGVQITIVGTKSTSGCKPLQHLSCFCHVAA